MTTGALQRMGGAGALLVAFAPSYAVPAGAAGLGALDRTFSNHAWALVARFEPIGNFGSDTTSVRHAGASVPATLDVCDIVRSLRDGGMPVAALAEIARVERKSVYAWLDGGEVRPANEVRMRTLHTLLADVGPDYKALWRVWSRPLASGTTLRALLSSDVLDVGTLTSALDELRPAMDRVVARGSVRRPVAKGAFNPVLSDAPVADFGSFV